MTRMLEIAAIALAAYAGLVGILFLLQRQLLYQPSGSEPDRYRAGVADMHEATVRTSDGLALTAWYKPPAEGRATLLYLHGNAGHIGYRGSKVRPYLDRGFGVLLPSWRGYGGNPGAPSEDGLYADGAAALAFLEGQGIAPDSVVLYGESLGTGVAVELAKDGTPFRALVLESPYSSIVAVAAAHFPFLPASWMVRDRYDAIDKIGGVRAPILVVHGERDRTIPIRFGRALFEAAPEPKTFRAYGGAGHNDLYNHGATADVIAFLEGLPTR